MPLYDYACTKCGHTFEVRHGFDEAHQEPCALCGAPVRRVFNAAPVLFKGSGFYVTDSRRSSGGAKPETDQKSDKPPSSTEQPATQAAPTGENAPAKSEPKASEPAA
jgi:putative FmdB family regulatory protein